MVHGTTWIDFSYKPPISAVEGRPLPNDFTIIVAMEDEGRVKYEVMSAKLAMTLYTSGHSLLAWRILDPYIPHEIPHETASRNTINPNSLSIY